MAVKFSDFTSSALNSTGFVVGWDSATNQNIQIAKSSLDSIYQATLVSGTNIKTINGSSVLGSGDLTINSLPALTSGSVLFSDGTTIAQDNSKFYWDDANNRLGIGTNTPNDALTVNGDITFGEGTFAAVERIRSASGGDVISFDPMSGTTQFGSSIGFAIKYPNITTNSSVGIGTSTPATELDVNGVITATGGNSTSWNGKQDALVSGTNIKTINGSSVLGSGDLTISGGGGLKGIHCILPITQSSERIIPTMVNFSNGTVQSTLANRLLAYPFIPANDLTATNLYMIVSSAGTNSFCRIGIYSDLNGSPNELLFISADLDCSTTGIKTAVANFNFVAGNVYWLAHHGGAFNCTIHVIPILNMLPIRYNSSGATSFNVVFQFNIPFSQPTPTIFPEFFGASINAPLIGIQI